MVCGHRLCPALDGPTAGSQLVAEPWGHGEGCAPIHGALKCLSWCERCWLCPGGVRPCWSWDLWSLRAEITQKGSFLVMAMLGSSLV